MSLRLRTVLVFLLAVGLIYFILKLVSVYWVIVFFSIILLYINLVFLLAFFEAGEKTVAKPSRWPSVSIVIPNYNGAAYLRQCIDSVKKLKYPGRKEIIVVDDGSTDSSPQILKSINGIKVMLKPENAGKAAALNDGIRAAKGSIIAAIDSDTFPEKDCLLKMVPLFDGDDVGAVNGLVRVYKPKKFIEVVQELEYLVAFGFFQSVLSELNGVFVVPGPMSLFRRSVLLKLGGFDETNITEDMEIAFRLQANRYRIVACPEAHIFTVAPGGIKPWFRQRIRWYRGKFFNTRKYSGLLFNRSYGEFGMFVFPFSVLVEALSILMLLVAITGNIDNIIHYFGFLGSYLSVTGSFFGALPVLYGINSSIYFYFIVVLLYAFLAYLGQTFSDKKTSLLELPQLVFFLLAYGLLVSTVYLASFLKEVNESDYSW